MVKDNRRLQFTPAHDAILTTILYSDIFSFPLTKEELWKFLLSDKKISRKEFELSLKNIHAITLKNGYFCLKGREGVITQRQKNLSEVSKKREIAKRTAKKLSVIPSILFIGISGGLAAGNVNADDDIDFVVITKKNTLFTTRLVILLMLEFLGVRRARTQKKSANTICLNLLFDETAIDWFKNTQDVYTAREIAQIVPLFERNDMYRRFLTANDWITHFLPNTTFSKKDNSSSKNKKKSNNMIISNLLIETVVRSLQMKSMRRHQTKEIITSSILAFHPNDYRISTLRKLRLKMRQLGLLTKF